MMGHVSFYADPVVPIFLCHFPVVVSMLLLCFIRLAIVRKLLHFGLSVRFWFFIAIHQPMHGLWNMLVSMGSHKT